MSRSTFGTWGAELADDIFCNAVAAGLVQLGWDRTRQRWRWGGTSWARLRRAWQGLEPAAQLAARWEEFSRTQPALRLVTPSLEGVAAEDAGFALDVLGLAAGAQPRCASVVADTSREGTAWHPWGWPLRIGVARGVDTEALARRIAYPQLMHFEDPSGTGAPLDLLVLTGSLREALAAVASGTAGRGARCVLVTGGATELPRDAVAATLASLRALAQTQAILLADLAGAGGPAAAGAQALEGIAKLLSGIVEEVAHDGPVDVALCRAARRSDPRARPLVSGDLRFLDDTPASCRLARLATKLVAAGGRVRMTIPEAFRGDGGGAIAPRSIKAGDVGRALRASAGTMSWDSEGDGASRTAAIAQAAEAAFEAAAAESEARYLQVGARAALGDGKPAPRTRRFESGGQYDLEVWIGPVEQDAWHLDARFPRFADDAEVHELQVVVSEPALLGAPRMGSIRLPAAGRSSAFRLRIYCRPGVERIEARIVVLHRGRVLQTGILSGALVAAGAAPADADRLGFELDAMPRHRLASLDARSAFGAAVLVNHDGQGVARRLGIVGDRVGQIRLGDTTLQGFVECFNAALSGIASNPEQYEQLRSEGNLRLLRALAQHGALLREVLEEDNEIGPSLVGAPRIQIVTARADAFLPLELAYRWEAPDNDAPLCEGAEEALRGPDATAACAARCGHAGGDARRLCPMGFWCLWKTIERFGHRPEDIQQPGEYSLYAEPIGARPTLARPSFGLVAGSEEAKRFDATVIDRVLAQVKASFSDGEIVANWEDWGRRVSAKHPGLLVVLPHHVRKAGDEIIQIGAASELQSTLVRRQHVVGEPPPDPPPTPIVLLLGCETAAAAIPVENFPARFRARGAAIVIGTIATVLGRHAGPVAEELIGRLSQGSGERSFGDLLVMARRALLLEGKAVALALTGFGDADWRLP
jgi:hypothetical protein